MLNSDQFVTAIAIKALGFALDFLFGQTCKWLKKRCAKRKHKRKPKPRRRH